MTGRVVEVDLLCIIVMLKSSDDGYFVFLNYKTGKFEVHNKKDTPSLCLVLPYDRLDERTVRHVQYTRAERLADIVKRMDEQNARLERERRECAVGKIAAQSGF